MKKNMVFTRAGSISVVVHSKLSPSAAEWDAMIEDMKTFRTTMKGILVYTEGGAPSATQRKQLRDVLSPQTTEPALTTVFTTSLIARMAVTALNLFFQNRMRAIEPSNYQEGLRHLRVPPTDWPSLMKILDDLAQTIDVSFPATYTGKPPSVMT